MYQQIVVATDGSGHADKAVEVAGVLATRFNAKLSILHVVHAGSMTPAIEAYSHAEHLDDDPTPIQHALARVPEWMSDSRSIIRDGGGEMRVLETLAERILSIAEDKSRKAGVENLERLLRAGDPVSEILNAAKETSADLIVVGSRGLSDAKALLLGSVSHKVSQLCECSCVTVK